MKILVLTSTFARWKGDIEPRFVDNLCHYLSESNEIHVVAPHAPNAATEETLDGIHVFRFRYCTENWESLAYDGGILPSLRQNRWRILLVPLFVVSQLMLSIKLLRRNHYDVIHAHWIIPQGMVAVIARLFAQNRPAVVVTSHGGDLFALKGPVLAKLKRWVLQRADQLTVVSSAMKSKAEESRLATGEEIEVIPMGVDSYNTFYPPENSTPREGMLFLGRLVEKKGVEHLLNAMPLVLEKQPETTLTIIGDGPLNQRLQALCHDKDISSKVRFLGSLSNQEIPAHLQKSAIAIFPSIVTDDGDQEGTPVSIMEALACECAVVVSDYPGARDIIVHQVSGLLVPQKSPSDLAEQINSLLEQEQLRIHLGENGRRFVQEKYDWKVISNRFSALFSKLSNINQSSSPKLKSSYENQ